MGGSCLLIRAVHVQVKIKLELTPAAVIEGFSLPEFSGSFLAVSGRVKITCAVQVILLRPLMPVHQRDVQVILTRRLTAVGV